MQELYVSLEQFKRALNMFIEKTYTPKVPNSDCLFYFGKIAILNTIINRNWSKLADENNMIDASEFYTQYSTMFKTREFVEFQGFTINMNDLNELFGFIKAQVPKQGEVAV